jgi:polyisoprenoid-binding protein YceI
VNVSALTGTRWRQAGLALLLISASGSALPAERYEIDPAHTFATFEYDHWGLSHQQARFDRSGGYILIDHEGKTADIYIEIDARSVNSGIDAFNEVLRSGDFFDVENYPHIRFRSTRLQFEKEQLVEVEGELTIKDVTRPLVLRVSHYQCRYMLIYGKRACGANAAGMLSRSEFGMARYAPFVSDQVRLSIRVEALLSDTASAVPAIPSQDVPLDGPSEERTD